MDGSKRRFNFHYLNTSHMKKWTITFRSNKRVMSRFDGITRIEHAFQILDVEATYFQAALNKLKRTKSNFQYISAKEVC